MKNKSNKSLKPFYIAFVTIIIFLFSMNFQQFFEIIVAYIRGDIIITYDDFPDIGEWVQIVTTILFSYLLWRATCESNKINERNLELQEKIITEENLIKTNRLKREIDILLRNVKTSNEMCINLKSMGFERLEKVHIVLFNNYELTQSNLDYLHVFCSSNNEQIKVIDRIEECVRNINTFKDILENQEKDSLARLNNKVHEENILNQMNKLSIELESELRKIIIFLDQLNETSLPTSA